MPQDNHSFCRLFKELGLEMTGYGPSLFGNRLVRTRMPGGVEAGGVKPPAIRLGHLQFAHFLEFGDATPQPRSRDLRSSFRAAAKQVYKPSMKRGYALSLAALMLPVLPRT